MIVYHRSSPRYFEHMADFGVQIVWHSMDLLCCMYCNGEKHTGLFIVLCHVWYCTNCSICVRYYKEGLLVIVLKLVE